MLDYAPGERVSMRQEVYRAAYEEANAELNEILAKFQQLRQRKDQVEKVVEMLRSVMGLEASAPAQNPPPVERLPEPVQPVQALQPAQPAAEIQAFAPGQSAEMQPEPAAKMADPASDPFQRRIDSALGLAGGYRDSREFGRRLSGGLQRG